MDQYPQMLYRFPGLEPMHGGFFATLVVHTDDEFNDAIEAGWHEATDAAKAAHEAELAAALAKPVVFTEPPAPPEDDVPPTRAELEQQAKELGIAFDKRWGDKRLADAIDAALKA